MMSIEATTISDAHEKIIKAILLEGNEQPSKHGITVEYPEPIAVRISEPLQAPRLSQGVNLTEEMMKIYAKQLQEVIEKTNTNKDFDYNCGNRWFDYPPNLSHGDGDNMGFNQVEKNVIEELKKDPTSRRAIICSIFPPMDYTKKHIPCISFLQFLIRGNKLHMVVYIRSNDMLSAWGSDAYALSEFQKYVAEKLYIPVGTLEIISVSAHIYYKRDAPELMKFRRKINW